MAKTGLRPGWNCVDAGAGTGFMSMFISSIASPGKVTAYEKVEKHAEIARENAEKFGLDNLEIKNKSVSKMTEKDLDLITLDMKGAEDVLDKCHESLRTGGWLVVYSPVINQAEKVHENLGEGWREIETREVLVRTWKVISDWTRPDHHMLSHTGFLTFARKSN